MANYGWGLFVRIPFLTGFLAVMICGAREVRSVGECLLVAMLSVAFAGGGFLLFAIEGLVCIVMAIPLALPLALIGGLAGHAAQPARWRARGAVRGVSGVPGDDRRRARRWRCSAVAGSEKCDRGQRAARAGVASRGDVQRTRAADGLSKH